MTEQVQVEDWDFVGADTRYMTHGLHPYPARMIPQIARRLIVRFSKPGPDTIVMDPFAGSGGVLVEASLKLPSEVEKDRTGARRSIGVDINPLAILLARAKTTPIEPSHLRQKADTLLLKISVDIKSYRQGHRQVKTPRFFNIDYWFKPQVQAELQIVREHINREHPSETCTRPFFDACFSKTVREASNTRSREFKLFRIAREELKEHNPDVLQIFRDNVENGVACMNEYYRSCELEDWARPIVLDEDTRYKTSIPDDAVDLVVTSPPYGDSRTTVAYGQFSRLSMQWLGTDGIRSKSVDSRSLGGRRAKSLVHDLRSRSLQESLLEIRIKDADRVKDVLSYFIDLNECLAEMSRVLRSRSRACVVIGNRTVKSVLIRTDRIISELGTQLDLEHETSYERRIPMKRMPWENAPTNIPGEKEKTIHTEHVVVLRKC